MTHRKDKQAKAGIERFLKGSRFSKVRTLEDVMAYNEEHADVEFHKGKSRRSPLRWLICYKTHF